MATSRLRLQKMMAFLTLLGADQVAQHLALHPVLAVGQKRKLLRDGLGGSGGLGDLDPLGIVQELVDEARDLRRHGGREEQRLAARRQELADASRCRE